MAYLAVSSEQQYRPTRFTHSPQAAREPRDPATVLPYALNGFIALMQ